MAKIKNKDFLKPSGQCSPQEPRSTEKGSSAPRKGPAPVSAERAELLRKCSEAATALRELGMKGPAHRIESLMAKTRDERFTVAFVGEFSRGKSTLINSLLGADVLPASALPTTALITRVGYGRTPLLITLNPDGSREGSYPLDKEAWKILKIDNFNSSGDSREGSAAIKVPVKWLGQYGVILLDTPGAGDLQEGRMKSVARALLASDAAVITVDATQPLSLSEQSFVQQKVLGARTPFLAVAVTKLDLVPLPERDRQMDYIVKLMRSRKWNFPVVIAGAGVQMPSDKYNNVNGSARLRVLIEEWTENPRREALVSGWLAANVTQVLDMAESLLADRKKIAGAKGEEQLRLRERRLEALAELQKGWGELREEMTRRCEAATAEFDSKLKQAAESMTERLQHEVDRFPEPKRWVEKEYNFRVRGELSALSQALDAWASRTVARDQAWLNGRLQRQFRTILSVETGSIGQFDDSLAYTSGESLDLEDLRQSQKRANVATMALGLGAAVALASVGGFIPLATMGVSGGAGLWSRSVFEKKIERQREEVCRLVAGEVPRIIREASSDSRSRLRGMYAEILAEAMRREQEWLAMQRDMISSERDTSADELSAKTDEALRRIAAIKRAIPQV
ncbi:MAG: dynamin family protein [Muribaculaceae bacterium]|nr:dynamin family protein [Muribaculaceae bacterium]